MLNAERATIFLYDASSGTLFSRVSSGSEISEIRFPSHLGIAGAVFEIITEMSPMLEPVSGCGHRFQDVITAAVVD